MSFNLLVERPAWSVPQGEKAPLLLSGLNALTCHHAERCPPYARVLDAVWQGRRVVKRLEDVPFLPAALFKTADLSSTNETGLVLRSSGTSGQIPSRITVDAEASARQSRAMVATLTPVLGQVRRPMLVIDSRQVILDPRQMTARGAGVLGLMKFGSRTAFALDADLAPDRETIRRFLDRHGSAPFLIFGFTWLTWSALYARFDDGELDLSNATLIHSGGWKTLEAQKVDNAAFRDALRRRFGLTQIYNFYGMVEQIGSLFLEGPDGLLHAPNVSDVVVRDEVTWEPLPPGCPGLLQVVSLIPTSHPGHSVLTEDRGEVVSVDGGAGGRLGQAIRLLGRLPRAELRGCSDVIAERRGA